MLPRILEPEVMDSPEEARDYDAMDHRSVNRVFVADFVGLWNGKGPILDVGTGTAQIPIELCRQVPTADIVAVDMARHMLALAQANVQNMGLQDRVRLDWQDAKCLHYGVGRFQAVISNSIIHHIPEPVGAIQEMLRVLARDGCLLVRDLLRPADADALQQLVLTYAGDANAHQQKMFADSLHAALTLAEIRALVQGMERDPNEVQQTSDRHWTWQIAQYRFSS